MAVRYGLNLSSNTDWSSGRYWCDLRNVLRAWGTPERTHEPANLPLDAEGCPAVDFGGFADLHNYPGGLYRWTFAGDGTLTWLSGVTGPTVENGGKSGTVVLDGDRPLSFRVTGVTRANPFRALTVRRGADEAVFDPDFVASVRPYHVLRFMDWQHTNYTPVAEWRDRPRPTDQQTVFPGSSGKGVALEHCLHLAAETDATAWLCVPHAASDAYVVEMAHLAALYRVPVMLEIGNELWNGGTFPVPHSYQLAASAANGLLTANDKYARLYQHVAWRLWKAVRAFRDAGVRVSGVLAGQAENRWYLESGLDFLRDKFGPVAETVGAVAYADYFWTDDDWNAGGPNLTRSRDWVNIHRALADRHGVPVVAAYEAGQHLTGNRGGEPQKRAAQSSQLMRDTYEAAAEVFERGAGDNSIYVWFASPDAWNGATGYWGLSEGLGVTCPKLDAVNARLGVSPPPPPPVPTTGFTGTLTYKNGQLVSVREGA